MTRAERRILEKNIVEFASQNGKQIRQVKDVAEKFGVSLSRTYKILKDYNVELNRKNKARSNGKNYKGNRKNVGMGEKGEIELTIKALTRICGNKEFNKKRKQAAVRSIIKYAKILKEKYGENVNNRVYYTPSHILKTIDPEFGEGSFLVNAVDLISNPPYNNLEKHLTGG